MPYNGSGTFTRVYDFTADRDAGSPTNVISADRVDGELDGMATGLTNCLTKDGQTTPTASIPMGSQRITSLGDATAATDAAKVSQIQNNAYTFIAGGGTADAITATFAPALTALTNGCEVCVRAASANTTTTPTFAPNGLTAKTIVKGANSAVVAGDIVGQHHELRLRYNSTTDKWHLLNPTIPAIAGTTVVNNGGTPEVALPRNAQVGTTYTFLTGDRGKHVTLSNGSAIAVTLPQAGSAGFLLSWFSYVENIGAGLVTITPTTSTINGAATLLLQTGEAYLITSDGTNYRALAMGHSTLAETDFVAGTDTLDMLDASTGSRKSVTGQILFNALADVATDASPATGDLVAAIDVSASNVAVKQTHASIQTLFAASAAQQETGTSTAVNVTPGVQARHPSAAKAWVKFDMTGTLEVAFNCDSVAEDSTGDWTVTFTTDFSGTNYVCVSSAVATANNQMVFNNLAAGTVGVAVYRSDDTNVETNTTAGMCAFFGDQ